MYAHRSVYGAYGVTGSVLLQWLGAPAIVFGLDTAVRNLNVARFGDQDDWLNVHPYGRAR